CGGGWGRGHPPWTRIFCALSKRRTGVSWPLTRRSRGLRVSVVHGGCPLLRPARCRHAATRNKGCESVWSAGDAPGSTRRIAGTLAREKDERREEEGSAGPAPGAQALPEGKHAEGRGGQRLEQRGDARRRRGHPLESRAEEEVGDGGGDQAEVEQEGPARGERAHDLALQEQDGGEQRRGQREGGGGERQRRCARQKALGGQRVHGVR